MPTNPASPVFAPPSSVQLREDQEALLERLSKERGNASRSSLIREAIDKTWPPAPATA